MHVRGIEITDDTNHNVDEKALIPIGHAITARVHT